MPIYLEKVKRTIVSMEDEPERIDNWYPSNLPSRRLWACLEILRDINDLLEEGVNAKNSGKRKKKVKILAGFVHSLAKSINKLCSSFVGSKEVRRELGKQKTSEVLKLKKEFEEYVPFERGSQFTNYRNKLTAHFEDSFWPKDASELLKAIPTQKIGSWLHICLHVLSDLTKLDIYSWSCPSGHDNFVRLMTNEPFILTMQLNEETGSVKQLVGLDIANESPKNTVAEALDEAIRLSQWMFKKDQPRIRGLTEHSGEPWNSFSEKNIPYKTKI